MNTSKNNDNKKTQKGKGNACSDPLGRIREKRRYGQAGQEKYEKGARQQVE